MVGFGLDTFGDVTEAPSGLPNGAPGGDTSAHARVIREVVEQGVLADRLQLDFFGVGEHHRADFAVSAPEIVLAAIAARSERITVGSAVTVLSSDDPIRVFQRFSTLDAIAPGRVEAVLGRGSFTESFPLFGHELRDYERLFEEKLALFAALARGGPVDWSGSIRPPLSGQQVFPTVADGRRLRCAVGVGGSPNSVVRAARHGMPLVLAVIGGAPERFVPLVELYRQTLGRMRQPALPVALHSPGFVGGSDADARDAFFPHYQRMHALIGAERGWPPLRRGDYEREIENGSLYVGSADTVAAKIARTVRVLGIQRFDLKYSAGTLPHAALMDCIERYAGAVVPRVRALLAQDAGTMAAAAAR